MDDRGSHQPPPQYLAQPPLRDASQDAAPQPQGFGSAGDLPQLVEFAQFLGQAAFTGVLGNAVYDGVRRGLQVVSRRWRARQAQSGTEPLTRDEATALAIFAVRMFRRLPDDARVDVIPQEPYFTKSGWWHVTVRPRIGDGSRPFDLVSLPPEDPAETTVTIRTIAPPEFENTPE